MKIAWVSQGLDRGGGDDIYDQRVTKAFQSMGHDLEIVAPKPLSRWGELFGVLRGIPYYRARFASSKNTEMVARAAAAADVAVVSWEPFDQFAYAANYPVILILHNVTSDALPQMYPESWVIRRLAKIVQRWEQRLYASDRVFSIAVLSENDRRLVSECAPLVNCKVLPPGMPPREPLDAQAPLKRELVIFGTYGWRPKFRDLVRFADDYARHGLKFAVLTDRILPHEANAILSARLFSEEPSSERGLRFGIVTDRFVAGHKLKVTAYIAAGCAVLSYSDVLQDFAGIEDAEVFVRHIKDSGDIEAVINSLESIEVTERNRRFNAFQAACAERFSWKKSAEGLLALCVDAAASRRAE